MMYDWRSAFYDASYDSYVAALAAAASASKSKQQPKQQQNLQPSQHHLRRATVSLNDNFFAASNSNIASNLNISDEYIYVYNIDENNKNENNKEFYDGNFHSSNFNFFYKMT